MLSRVAPALTKTSAREVDGQHAARLARLIREQFGFVWRLLRSVGVSEAEAQSAVQAVFEAAAQRIGDIRIGSERSFLFSTALHVAAHERRNRAPESAPGSGAPALEDLDAGHQAREILGALLVQMPLELRVVFALYQIERFTNQEIADVVGIPLDVADSRLSEAEEHFASHLDADGDLSLSLLAAAREERPPARALSNTLSAVGLRSPVQDLELEAGAGAISAPGVSSSGKKLGASSRSPLALAAKWLVLGWLVGLLGAALIYGVSEVVSAGSHTTVAH